MHPIAKELYLSVFHWMYSCLLYIQEEARVRVVICERMAELLGDLVSPQ